MEPKDPKPPKVGEISRSKLGDLKPTMKHYPELKPENPGKAIPVKNFSFGDISKEHIEQFKKESTKGVKPPDPGKTPDKGPGR